MIFGVFLQILEIIKAPLSGVNPKYCCREFVYTDLNVYVDIYKIFFHPEYQIALRNITNVLIS